MQTYTGPRLASESDIYVLARPPRLWALPSTTLDGQGTSPPQVPGPTDRIILLRAAAEARSALRTAAIAAEEAAARARAVAAELDKALAAMQSGMPRAGDRSRHASGAMPNRQDLLSVREREVLTLVTDGLSNKAIAERLYISPNTVKTHVASLLHKLNVQTRVQLAALAASQPA